MIFTRGLELAERLCLCSLDPTQPNFIVSASPIYPSTSNLWTRLGQGATIILPCFHLAEGYRLDSPRSSPVWDIRAQCRPQREGPHGSDPARGLVTRCMFRSLTTQGTIRPPPLGNLHWATSTGQPPPARVQAAPSWWAATIWLLPSCFLTGLDNGEPKIDRVTQVCLAERLVWTCGCVYFDNGQ